MAAAAKQIVILGGGWGGVGVAQGLERLLPRGVADIHLVSQDNFFLFQPMLPEVAGGAIETRHILNPLRQLCRRATVTVARAEEIDLERKTVTVVQGRTENRDVIRFDYLVIAVGAVTNFSEVNGIAQHAFGLRTVGDALYIRNHVIGMLEEADAEDDPALRQQLLTFVVTGGGFSGVETMAEIRDLVRDAARHYRRINPREIRFVLLHMMDRLLPELGAELAAFAHRSLERSGVEIRLKTLLTAATETAAVLEGGEEIPTATLICTVGTAPNPLLADLPCTKDQRGRLVVNSNLEVEGWPGVWGLGDCAAVPIAGTDKTAPPTAQFALREGDLAARNIAAAVQGRAQAPFSYSGLGQFISLGHRNAVVETNWNMKISGFIAWWMWRTYYLGRLPSLSRKVRVALDWTLDLIFGRDITQLPFSRAAPIGRSHYEAGDVICRQGDPADQFYVIVDGEVEITRQTPEGNEVLVARQGKGDYFGEMALLGGAGQRSATVRALTPVNLLTLDREAFILLTRNWASLREDLVEAARARAA